MATHKHDVLIIGGGTAGITVAARLRIAAPELDIALVEPSETHYYQPLWTLVGAGVFDREVTARPEEDYIPEGTTWYRTRASTFSPDTSQVELASGDRVEYTQLIICAGIQIDWGAVKGLQDALGTPGVCSNYTYETVDSTWQALRELRSGNAIFTFPNTPIKCGGAPQKIMYLADDYLRRAGVRENATVTYVAPGERIFGVEKYRKTLEKVVERKGIETLWGHHLVEIRADAKQAVFEPVDGGKKTIMDYGLIHVTPPMSAPDFLAQSPFANADGWIDVDKFTLQHHRYPDVFSLGDCAGLPTAKTGAAIRKQAPVLVENLLARRAGKKLSAAYDGYSSCPLITGYGKLILAEFDYDGQPAESFPFDQAQERYSMYALKAYGLPSMYWHGMLRGRV